ncbi:MAG: hypothetical protein MHPSP_000596 [Paramarteilia canceri]
MSEFDLYTDLRPETPLDDNLIELSYDDLVNERENFELKLTQFKLENLRIGDENSRIREELLFYKMEYERLLNKCDRHVANLRRRIDGLVRKQRKDGFSFFLERIGNGNSLKRISDKSLAEDVEKLQNFYKASNVNNFKKVKESEDKESKKIVIPKIRPKKKEKNILYSEDLGNSLPEKEVNFNVFQLRATKKMDS